MIRHCFAAAILGVSLLTACARSDDRVTIEVLAPWDTPAEESAFKEATDAFENENPRIRVRYFGTRDVSQVLRARVERGSPPHIAVFPRLYDLLSYVDQGALRPLRGLPAAADERLIRIGAEAYGVSIAAHVKSLVWYAGKPVEWEVLDGRAKAMFRANRQPWCLGMSSPPVSGWPGTDWIENLVLNTGVGLYEEWTAGDLPWTDGRMRDAWTAWKDMVAPGPLTHPALLTGWTDSGLAMVDTPPGCLLHHAASFNANGYGGHEVSVHRFPGREPYDRTLISEDVMGMFRDTPEARRLVDFLGDPGQRKGHDAWRVASDGTHLVLGGRDVDPDAEPNLRRIEQLLRAGTLCRDASDLMPPAMTEAFQHAVLRFLQDPGQLDDLLADLEAVRRMTSGSRLKLKCIAVG